MTNARAHDIVSAIVTLLEGSATRLPVDAWERRFGAPCVRMLVECGALVPASNVATITCEACHRDHVATIEPNGLRGFRHYCSEAGWVVVPGKRLRTLELDRSGGVAALWGGPNRIKELVSDRAWMLGDFTADGIECTLALACRLSSTESAEELARALQQQMPQGEGLVLTTSDITIEDLVLPHDYKFVPIDQVLGAIDGEPRLDEARLARWITARRRARRAAGRSKGGRPSKSDRTVELYEKLRAQGRIDNGMTKSAVTREMQKVWKAEGDPEDTLGYSTAMGAITHPR